MRMNRRSFGQGLMALGGAMAMGPRIAHSQQVSRITVTSYGGVWETVIRETFVADFERRTGVKADIQLGTPPQWFSQVAANPANPPLHVVVSNIDRGIVAGRAGLLDRMDPAKVPNLKDVPARFTEMAAGWGTVFDYGMATIVYHRDRVKNPPRSMAEFVDRTAKGEWRASLPSTSYGSVGQALIWSLTDALGGSVENIDPAVEAARRMKKNTVTWSGVTEFLNHLATGEADIGIYLDGRTWEHFDAGNKWIAVAHPQEKPILLAVAAFKVKNAPEIAWEYVNSMFAPEPQAVFARRMTFGVTNSKVEYSPQHRERLVTWENARIPPDERIGALIPQWIERWNKEVR